MSGAVLVVGASAAGLHAAIELASRGLRVEVADCKAAVGENTVCGGALSSFAEEGLDIPGYCVASTIKAVRIYSPDGAFWEMRGGGGYGHVLWRDRWERYLASKAERLGAAFEMGLKRIRPDAYGAVIGADGLTGVTPRLAGLPRLPPRDIYKAAQATAEIPSHPGDRIDLYFGSGYAPKGYAWVFPEGGGRVRAGLGVPLGEEHPRILLTRFLQRLGAEPAEPLRGKFIPLARPPGSLVRRGILLTGDAGRLCDPLTGGGIANAAESGRAAARAVAEGEPGRYDLYVRGILRRNRIRYALKEVLTELSDPEFNDVVSSMRGYNPEARRVSWAITWGLTRLALKKPRLFTRHRILRRALLSPGPPRDKRA